MAGDQARHDTLIGDALTGPAARNDVVVLAQASMAVEDVVRRLAA